MKFKKEEAAVPADLEADVTSAPESEVKAVVGWAGDIELVEWKEETMAIPVEEKPQFPTKKVKHDPMVDFDPRNPIYKIVAVESER